MRPFSEIRIKPSAWAYYLFVSLLIINDALGNSLISGYSESTFAQLMLVGELALAILCLFFQCNNKFSLTFFAGLFAVGCAAYVFGGRTGLLVTLLAAALGSSADPDTVLKLVFWEKLLVFLLVVGLSLVEILPGREALFELSNTQTKGVTLGYTHANTFSATVVMLLLLFAAINRRSFSLWKLLLIASVELVNYYLTRSRIGFIVIVLLLVAALCVKNAQLKRVICGVGKYFLWPVLLLNFSFILLRLLADTQLLSVLDIKVFNGRMGFSAMYLEAYGLSLFGAPLDETVIAAKSWYYALDNGYTIILLYYGVVGLIVFLLTYEMAAVQLARKGESILVIIAMCFMLWMMFEGITLTASGNFIFLLIGKEFSQAKPKKRLAW